MDSLDDWRSNPEYSSDRPMLKLRYWLPGATQVSDWATAISVSGPEIQKSGRPVRPSCRNNHIATWCLQELAPMCQGPGSRGQEAAADTSQSPGLPEERALLRRCRETAGTKSGVREGWNEPWSIYQKKSTPDESPLDGCHCVLPLSRTEEVRNWGPRCGSGSIVVGGPLPLTFSCRPSVSQVLGSLFYRQCAGEDLERRSRPGSRKREVSTGSPLWSHPGERGSYFLLMPAKQLGIQLFKGYFGSLSNTKWKSLLAEFSLKESYSFISSNHWT